jgi:hypothetical protein
VDVLKIHTADGQTHSIDLQDSKQAQVWLARLARDEFQATLQGISLVERHCVRVRCTACGESSGREIGVQYSVARPDDARRVFMHAEWVEPDGKIKGGERITVFADDHRLTLMAHAGQPAARVTFAKVGKQTFNALKAEAHGSDRNGQSSEGHHASNGRKRERVHPESA